MRRILGLAAAALAVAASASAQPAPWEPERLTAGWTVTPGLALGVLWDNNVTVQNEGNPQLNEWVALVNPRGEIAFNGRRTHFDAGYSGALERYRTLEALSRYEQRSRLSLRHQATRRLTIDSRASYAATPTTDRLEIGTLPFVDIGSRMFDVGGGVSVQLSPRTGLRADYRFNWLEFDREDDPLRATFLDGGHAHSPSVSVTHALGRRLSVGGEWRFQRALVHEGADAFRVQHLVGSANLQVGPNTSVQAALGASHLDVSNAAVSVWGPSMRAGLSHRIDRVSISTAYERTFVPSFSFGGVTGNQQLSASVRLPVSTGGRITLAGSAAVSSTEAVEELGQNLEVNTFWMQASLGYQLARWLRTEGFVSSSHQTAIGRAERGFDRVRIGIQVITLKPMRID